MQIKLEQEIMLSLSKTQIQSLGQVIALIEKLHKVVVIVLIITQ